MTVVCSSSSNSSNNYSKHNVVRSKKEVDYFLQKKKEGELDD